MANKQASDLPFNADAEKAVLGSALISKKASFIVLSRLKEEDFYLGKHQIIYHALNNIINNKQMTADTVTMTEELINIKELENIGGVNYLKECSDAMVTLAALEFYINVVLDQSVLRSMLVTIRNIDNRYRSEDIQNINDFIIESENNFRNSISRRNIVDFISTSNMADQIKNDIIKRHANDEDSITGVTTGFNRLNRITQGFQNGEVTILAARPSVGKTALALNFAFKAATRSKVSVGIFSIEMKKETLFERLVAAESQVSLKKIKTGSMTDEDRVRVSNAINVVAQTNIYIDDTSQIPLPDLMAKARKLQASDPNLGLIMIDYIGLINVPMGRGSQDNRQEAVRQASGALKKLAKEMNIPIIVLCQVRREVEGRGENKRPELSDLRESGAIEQDADVVMMLYRSDYYNQGEEPKKPRNGAEMTKYDRERELVAAMPKEKSVSYLEVLVKKNRNGQTGNAPLFFYKDISKFDEPDDKFVEAYQKTLSD